ncbi:MAG: regulatory protein LuxR [Sphingobacteriaceae bacterium]|jgi:DNA-binding CsgD family transcriptional regulator|nr:regulatory protein LuxR [Sphingobacteriaceae bacterium]
MNAHKNMLPGMNSKEVEFYAVGDNKVMAIHDEQIWNFQELPQFVFEIIRKTMGFNASVAEMQHFILDHYNRLDFTPDISEDGTMSIPEHLGNLIPLENGQVITASEVRVLSLYPMPDKNIADTLCLAESTVIGHGQSIRAKLGLTNRAECALWTSRNGI